MRRVIVLVMWTLVVASGPSQAATTAPPSPASPSPSVLYPDEPDQQRAYELGFSDGVADGRDQAYDEGFADGREDGERAGRDEGDLQRDVQDEAEETPSPTPTSTATSTDSAGEEAVTPQVVEKKEPGFPWWPVSFAVVASVWFVTRRVRRDADGA